MDLRKVKKLIELVEESGIAELEVTSGDESVRIAMPGAGVSGVQPVISTPVAALTSHAQSSAGGNAAEISLAAPMAGTFYRSPHPEAAPFVEVGQVVEPGEVVCIIESMKMMHEVRAEHGGTVAQVCIDNATPVATGDVLLKLS